MASVRPPIPPPTMATLKSDFVMAFTRPYRVDRDLSPGQAGTATTGARRRRIAACTTKVIKPPAARQAARNSSGATVLPVASRIHGTIFCATKPPRLPTELMAASPAAADAPVRNLEGRLHSTG